MGKGRSKQSEKWQERLSDQEIVDVALREMKLAIPKIKRRVMEREARTAEWRFRVPKPSTRRTEKDED